MPEQPVRHFLLLRGLTRESAHWGDFVPALQAQFPSARLTLLDLPGAGPFYREVSPLSIAAILDRVRMQAVRLGALQKPVTLVGISLGGMVYWAWLLKYAAEIDNAVLINTSQGGLSPFYRRLRWDCYGKLFPAAFSRRVEDRESGLLELLSNRTDAYADIAAEWVAIQKARPVSGKNAGRQLYAAATYCPGGRKPEPPVLLINSLGDKLVDPGCSRAIADRYALELRTHSWGGHDLTVDAAEWVARQIADWLERN